MNRFAVIFVLVLVGALATGAMACGGEEDSTPTASPTPMAAEMQLSSTAFQEGDPIPAVYSCDGNDVSVPLAWGGPPAGTGAFALVMDDPDAPGRVFTHWVIFNIPAETRGLEEDVPGQARLASGALQGKNDFGDIGYGGPCPPGGPAHRYQFALYALDQPLDLQAGASKRQVLDAIQGHVLAEGRLTGTYQM
jgi:Raf kinase inhibitor-like YbhB/YbcL family protein